MPQKINVERLEIYATDLECRLISKSQSEKKIPEMEIDPIIERQMHYFKMQYDVRKIESHYNIGLKNIFFLTFVTILARCQQKALIFVLLTILINRLF